MTDAEFRDALDELCWSHRGFAAMLHLHFTTVQRWANGRYKIPAPIAQWLTALAACHRQHQLPADWRDHWDDAASEAGLDV